MFDFTNEQTGIIRAVGLVAAGGGMILGWFVTVVFGFEFAAPLAGMLSIAMGVARCRGWKYKTG